MNPSMMVQPTPMQAPPPPQPDQQSGGGGQGNNFISQQSQSDERETAYESAFKDSAYNVFATKHPDLVPSIVTFKVIKSSIDDGDAVGAFILSNQGETLYVPIIMSDNTLKPMEILYSKRMDKFVPFNKEWVTVIMSTGQQTMGEGVKPSEATVSDVDMSPMIRPPLDGRTVYASDDSLNHLDIIKMASNEVKAQYKDTLLKYPELLKFAAQNFEPKEISQALAPHTEKVAAAALGLEVVDSHDSAAKVKALFGSMSGLAMTKIAKDGFAFKDNRVDLNKAFGKDMRLNLEEPSHSGVYTIYMCDGSAQSAVVIVDPICMDRTYDDYPRALSPTYSESSGFGRKPKNFMVILPNGDYFCTHKLIATSSTKENFSGAVADMVYGDKSPKTVSKTNICFVKVDGDVISGTEARYVDKTETGRDGAKKYFKEDALGLKHDKYIYREKHERPGVELEILHAKTPSGRISKPTNSNLVIVPTSFKIVKLGVKLSDRTHMTNAKDILQFIQEKLQEDGGKKVKLQNLGAGEYAINHRPVGSYKTACVKLATDFAIAMPVAMEAFSGLALGGDSTTMVIEKRAGIFSSGTNGAQLPPEAIQQMAGGGGQPQGQGQPSTQPMPGPMGQPQGPGMMQAGAGMGDPDIYGLVALNSLSHNPDVRDLLSVYSPTIEKAMDNIGRMLMTFWIRGYKAKQSLGEETYYTTEESLRTVFKGIGGLLIKINRQVTAMPESSDM